MTLIWSTDLDEFLFDIVVNEVDGLTFLAVVQAFLGDVQWVLCLGKGLLQNLAMENKTN